MAVMERIRVLLVDDHPTVRQAIRMRLAVEGDIEVVGEARDGAEGVVRAQELAPDVILMDIEMTTMNGLSAAHELHSAVPGARVVMLSMHDDEGRRLLARVAGASDFVSKSQAADTLPDAIRNAVR
jgi:DNA-binding NarL/FixJ family response regulator